MARRALTKPGLAAERTLLSWERSCFGFLVGGALVMLREHGPLGPARTGLAVLAVSLALLILALGVRRSRRFRPVGDGLATSAPHLEVVTIGAATVAFATAVVVVLLFAA